MTSPLPPDRNKRPTQGDRARTTDWMFYRRRSSSSQVEHGMVRGVASKQNADGPSSARKNLGDLLSWQTWRYRLLQRVPFIEKPLLVVEDTLWIVNERLPFRYLLPGVAAVLVLLWALGWMLSPAIGPNIHTADGFSLTGLTVDEAEAELSRRWQEDQTITLILNSMPFDTVRPADVGFVLDARSMAQQAKNARLSGVPLGVTIEPVVAVDIASAQSYLLDIVDTIYVPAYDAGFEWQDGRLVATPGTPSLELDVPLTLERMETAWNDIIRTGSISLITTSTSPVVIDSSEYLQEAEELLQKQITFIGYDPLENISMPWSAPLSEQTNWLAASADGLVLRQSSFRPFYQAINDMLTTGEQPRYIDEYETLERAQEAISAGEADIYLRVHYMPGEYEVQPGDTGSRIGRISGLPFGKIDEANPGVDWNALSIDQIITLPPRDMLLEEEPVPNKRIVVDLDRLYMVAYEDSEVKFFWPISSGRPSAPTLPGIYQILEKTDVAYGSSFALCDGQGYDCSQWTMYWFMGIYEVIPGLLNGFHGAVLLPNGGYLGGGESQARTTYGCVMSENSLAEELYAWADVGTTVEIFSYEFPPKSDLGKYAREYITQQIAIPTFDAVLQTDGASS